MDWFIRRRHQPVNLAQPHPIRADGARSNNDPPCPRFGGNHHLPLAASHRCGTKPFALANGEARHAIMPTYNRTILGDDLSRRQCIGPQPANDFSV